MSQKNAAPKIGAGALRAALRQGAKELGQALKAFPESIGISEPGGMLNPTQGEIAAGNRTEGILASRLREADSRAAVNERHARRDDGPAFEIGE